MAIVFICSLGLLAIASFTAKKRTKEVGIRRILGADISSIIVLLSRDFMAFVFIANGIALPLAWLAIHQWLQRFVFQIDIEWWMFLRAGMVSLVLAIATTSAQILKVAVGNPVNSLRYE